GGGEEAGGGKERREERRPPLDVRVPHVRDVGDDRGGGRVRVPPRERRHGLTLPERGRVAAGGDAESPPEVPVEVALVDEPGGGGDIGGGPGAPPPPGARPAPGGGRGGGRRAAPGAP